MSIKNAIKSGLVRGFSLPPVHHLARKLSSDSALIFMLHRFQDDDLGIKGHDPAFLRQCLEELRRQKYQLVSVDDIVNANLNGEVIKNAVAFTVDDGYLDHAHIGGDAFADYDCPATFYLISDFINDVYWPEDAKVKYLFETTPVKTINWQCGDLSLHTSLDGEHLRHSAAEAVVWAAKELSIEQMQLATISLAQALEVEVPVQAPSKYRPMSWDDARKLEKSGMRIGAHTCQHVTLSQEDDPSAHSEIMGSIDAIKRNIENPSKVFCYPTGRTQDFTHRDIDILKQGDFSGAVSAEPGYFKFGDMNQMFTVPRMGMPDKLVDFRQYTCYPELFKSKIRSAIR